MLPKPHLLNWQNIIVQMDKRSAVPYNHLMGMLSYILVSQAQGDLELDSINIQLL